MFANARVWQNNRIAGNNCNPLGSPAPFRRLSRRAREDPSYKSLAMLKRGQNAALTHAFGETTALPQQTENLATVL